MNMKNIFDDVKGQTEVQIAEIRDVLDGCLKHDTNERKGIKEIQSMLREKLERLGGVAAGGGKQNAG